MFIRVRTDPVLGSVSGRSTAGSDCSWNIFGRTVVHACMYFHYLRLWHHQSIPLHHTILAQCLAQWMVASNTAVDMAVTLLIIVHCIVSNFKFYSKMIVLNSSHACSNKSSWKYHLLPYQSCRILHNTCDIHLQFAGTEWAINAAFSIPCSSTVSTRMGDRLWTGKPFRYVTSQLGQLSLSSLWGR